MVLRNKTSSQKEHINRVLESPVLTACDSGESPLTPMTSVPAFRNVSYESLKVHACAPNKLTA
jgi:hypothetical protein